MKTSIDFTLGVRPGRAVIGRSWLLLYGSSPDPVAVTVFSLDIDLSHYLLRRVDEIIEYDRADMIG